MPWRCFLVEPSPFLRRSLRRYSLSPSKCPNSGGYHNAIVTIDPKIEGIEEGGFLKYGFEQDPRWPRICACGYGFLDTDDWQVSVQRLYQGSPDGKLYSLRDLPPGATWNAPWLQDATPDRYSGPDGKAWCIMMPGGVEWIVYGYASGPEPRGKWAVQGTVPNITVHPSINMIGVYHGYISNGVISEDCEQRKFEGIPRTA